MLNEKRKLNKEQLAAVTYTSGPLLIVAGAGTGKTTVITERVKYLITQGFALPAEILALTFTEKASREMEERIDQALPYGYTQMWISTFHSFCDRVLRAEALQIGLDPKFALMTQAETIQFLKSHFFDLDLDYFKPLGNPYKFITGLIQHFSRLQDEDITPGDYLAWVEKEKKKIDEKNQEEVLEAKKWQELAKAFKKYDDLKTKESVMDYGDLIIKTLKLFRDRSNVLKKYRDQFKYILVDEFQDTNVAQYDLIKLLAPAKPYPNLTAVCDDFQAIYKFRGAAISNILHFKDDYQETKVVILNKNYRSSQKILDAAHKLIKNNDPDTLESKLKIDKSLVSQINKLGEKIEFIYVARIEQEAEEVAKKIAELSKVYTYKEFAILVRANNHADPFIRSLSFHGIPHQFLGPAKLFRQEEILDLIAYLKVLTNYEDSVSFYRLLASDFINVNGRDLATLGIAAKKENKSLFEICEHLDRLVASDETKEKISKLVSLINKHFEDSKKLNAGQIIFNFLEEFNFLPTLITPTNIEEERKAINITVFFEKLKGYEANHDAAKVQAVVDWIDLLMDLGESPLSGDSDWFDNDAVNILTVHGSKGLEFPVVFLVNLVSQRFPSMQRSEQIPIPEELIKETLPTGDYHLQEERRLFYVGMTRAKQRLFLTAANYYGEGKRDKKISPFVYEAIGQRQMDLSKKESKTKDKKQDSDSFANYSPLQEVRPDIKKEATKLKITYLSYSQIETFKTCPLHYKLKYIVKVPTPQTASQSFGTSIHAAMKHFYDVVASSAYESVKLGEKPGEKLIHNCLKENWLNKGFENKIHEAEFFAKGKMYLSGYLEHGFDKNITPALMEEKFTLPLDETLKIGGTIDRVDILSDGTIEVIDYKTGATIPTQKEVDKNLQLSFYALASATIPFKPFGKNPEDIKLSLYYFDTQEKITTIRTKAELERARQEILETKEEIQNSNFECQNNFFCQNCEFKMFCKSN